MELKKCNRCGVFFASSEESTCYSCSIKDKNDVSKLNSIIENSPVESAYELSINSGVKLDNINRYIENNLISL